MKRPGTWHVVTTLFCALLASATVAADFKIRDAWAKAPAPGQQVVGVYFTILSDHGGTLLKVSSPMAKAAELHDSRMVKDVMQMRPLPRMTVVSNQAITLSPGGTHVMLLGVSKVFSAGDQIPIVATFENHKKKKMTVKFTALVKNE
jgi:copper(I)-binding protein